MKETVAIVGAGLAGSEAALQLASHGVAVLLYEMRPTCNTPIHKTDLCAELVCSNSLKSTKTSTASGLLKEELHCLGSPLYALALKNRIPAGAALAVDRLGFANSVTRELENSPSVSLIRKEITCFDDVDDSACAIILATGPLTSDSLANYLLTFTGIEHLSFYDAAAPVVMADSLDMNEIFRMSRYENKTEGDYLNIALDKDAYYDFVEQLCNAQRVIVHDFETKELFQACQPIEEVARSGKDSLRFGALKPVGLIDPKTGRRPWAVVQLRAEDAYRQSYNLVGFQTNLAFSEQQRVFSLLPGMQKVRFARYGVMHKNTFIDAPKLLDCHMQLESASKQVGIPVFVAGQLSGTEGYCEAIRSGLQASLQALAFLRGIDLQNPSPFTLFGALLAYALNPSTVNYQPHHVNFGLLPPLDRHIRNKGLRYDAYAARAHVSLTDYCAYLARLRLNAEKQVSDRSHID